MVICRAAVPDIEREASAELADDFGMDEQMSPLAGRQNIEFTNRQLVSLILPMLAEQLLGITVGLADSLMVATVGDASISAVSLVDSVSALMIYIFSAMATGGAVVAGQYLGRREREEACRSAQQLMVLLGVVSLAVTALLYLFRDLIVTRLFGHRRGRHGGDEHLLQLRYGLHSGHRALQRRRGALPHDVALRCVAQGVAADERHQCRGQRHFDLRPRLRCGGRRHSHARLAHGGGGRDRVAALQRKARAASFRHPRVPL